MKKASFTLLGLSIGALLCADYWQNPTTIAVPQNAAPATGSSGSNSHSYSYGSDMAERRMDKIYDFDVDSLNLEDGTLNWKGKTFSIGNSRIVRSRFERYLATNFDDANFASYQKILAQIAALLSPNNDSLSPESVKMAWQLLYDAAEYDVDNDGCLTIANTVYTVFRTRNEYKAYKISEADSRRAREAAESRLDYLKQKEKYDREKAYENVSLHRKMLEVAKQKIDADVESDRIKSRKDGEKLEPTPDKSDGAYKLRAEMDLARDVANEAALVASMQAMGVKSVYQFQSQIISFMLSRRFQHATILSYFYRHLFKGNYQNFEVGKDEFTKFFPLTNFVPNNDIVENLSTEARNDVREGMIAVENLYDSGQRYTALMRLMEVFVLGENEPSVRQFPYEKKVVLHELYRDMSAAKDMSDNRDLGGISETIEKIKTVANDFPYREILSKVKTGQQASNLKVMSARAAAFAGDLATARADIAEAGAIWPLNPELDRFTAEVMDASIGKEKYAKNFEALNERGDFRGIVSEASEYAMALKGSPEKVAALKEIVNKVSQIDILVAQATELNAQGNSYIAWEMLERAKLIDDTDPVLSRAIAALAPYVADYVKILNKAKAAEMNGRHAEALNNYLQAQDVFPTSQACRIGIESASRKVLDLLNE